MKISSKIFKNKRRNTADAAPLDNLAVTWHPNFSTEQSSHSTEAGTDDVNDVSNDSFGSNGHAKREMKISKIFKNGRRHTAETPSDNLAVSWHPAGRFSHSSKAGTDDANVLDNSWSWLEESNIGDVPTKDRSASQLTSRRSRSISPTPRDAKSPSLGEAKFNFNTNMTVDKTSTSATNHAGCIRTLEVKETPQGRCPFKHGTVYSDPYPGYVHGNPKRGICPNGCRPQVNDDILEADETPQQTLLREAMEYIELYYHEREEEMRGTKDFMSKEERKEMAKQSIEQTGTYEHTFDELEHGARVAWRNAPKCSNRKYWSQLKLLDCRDVDTNEAMYDSCIQHLAKAMACGSSEAYVTVFKPAPTDGSTDGPRIWNDQLLQYAAYNDEDGKVTGDPKNLAFTQMLKERFGWKGPPDGKQGPYDYLPLVVQVDPNGPPKLFDVPLEVAPPVYIHHPQYPELSALGMKWYPIPAVCALDMTIGGLNYTAVPFNGWYASTEVLRDLTDADRYNMLVPVAEALGMDANTKPGRPPLWIDDVMSILNKAVYHSFETAKIAMVDHHTLINMFWNWYNDELKHRKYCPVNWKWVIPPMSSTTSPAYMGLNRAQEYTLKPAYIVGKGFRQLEASHFGLRDTSKAVNDFIQSIWVALLFKRMISRFRGRKAPVLIIYASVTGNAAKYASDLGSILNSSCNVSFFDACGVNAATDTETLTAISRSTLTVVVGAWYNGNGEVPSLAAKFFSSLFNENGEILKGKKCAVLGFGSSAYPIFCGAAAHLSKKLAEVGADEIIHRGECDAVKGETPMFLEWSSKLIEAMASQPGACQRVVEFSKNIKEGSSVLVTKRNTQMIMDDLTVHVFSAKEVKNAAAKSFMLRRGSTGSASATKSSIDSSNKDNIRKELIMKIISSSDSGHGSVSNEKGVSMGYVTVREDLISSAEHPTQGCDSVTRKTSLVKINLDSCGNPPYQPGDHVQIFPRNVVSIEKLHEFIINLSENPSLSDQIYVSFESDDISSSELAASYPLLSGSIGRLLSLESFLQEQVAILSPISMEACQELSSLARDGKDQTLLLELSKSEKEYEKMNSMTGLKWIDLFDTFPSLSKKISISFLLCNMKMNHPRSYSISSCKAIVGSELHLCVGRFIFNRGGSKLEAGVCSNFITSLETGDQVCFRLSSTPSFHHPLDPSCPVIFICTGTGFAPIRGLLQKRSHFLSRGEKLGATFLFFGSRSSKEGLFHKEIEDFRRQGVITKIFLSYSREPGAPREYATDKLKSDRIKRLLAPTLDKPNTHIYICGSANMAETSKSVLAEISSKATLANITADGRLHCDVFGALGPPKSIARKAQRGSFAESTVIRALDDGDLKDILEADDMPDIVE